MKNDSQQALPQTVVVAAKRTAFGALSGVFARRSATDLAVDASKAAIASAKVDPKDIDQSIVGNVQQTSPDAPYIARHVGLRCGMHEASSALTLNRLCGSGFEAVVHASEQIALGKAKCVLAVGAENMTQAPHVLRGLRGGLRFPHAPPLEDSLWSALTDSYVDLAMGATAENVAKRFHVTRGSSDAYAVLSQGRWQNAHANQVFAEELVEVEGHDARGRSLSVVEDECPRPDTSIEKVEKLRPVFAKDGVVTAANASAISDGAASLILAERSWAESRGLAPLAVITHGVTRGVDPAYMGLGPVPAIRALLDETKLTIEDIDLFEVNEAFAPQFLAVQQELGLPTDKTNACGGAIALGHPLGATGARIVAHLVHQLQRHKLKRAVGSACIGGGQGIAILIEQPT